MMVQPLQEQWFGKLKLHRNTPRIKLAYKQSQTNYKCGTVKGKVCATEL